MLRRLLAHIDALGDRVHPIAVLMLRKQKFWQGPELLLVIVHLVLFLGVWCGNGLAHDFGPFINAFSLYLWFLPLFPFLFSFGIAVNGYHLVKKSDPLLLLIPLSDRSIWLGFFLTGLYQGLAAWCYVVLTYSYCYSLGWVSLEWVLLYPLLGLLAGYFVAALGISMSVAAKTVVHQCFLFPIFVVPMWCGMMMLSVLPAARSGMLTGGLFHSIPSSLFEPICWIPMLVIAVPAYLWTAWKLFNFNLVRRRSFILKYCVSILAYVTLTALLVGLWFALRWVLGGV